MSYSPPASWTDCGMDWESPDSCKAVYLDALAQAVIERYQALFSSDSQNWTVFPTLALASYPFGRLNFTRMTALHNAIFGLLPLVNSRYPDQTSGFIDISQPADWPPKRLSALSGWQTWIAPYNVNYYAPASAIAAIGQERMYSPAQNAQENNLWLLQSYKLLNLMRYACIYSPSSYSCLFYKRTETRTVSSGGEISENDSGWVSVGTASGSCVGCYGMAVKYGDGSSYQARQSFKGEIRISWRPHVPRKIAGVVFKMGFSSPLNSKAYLPAGTSYSNYNSPAKYLFSPLVSDYTSAAAILVPFQYDNGEYPEIPSSPGSSYYGQDGYGAYGAAISDWQFNFRNW